MFRLPEEQAVWIFLIFNVIVCTTVDTVSTMAWEKKSGAYFTATILIAPFVFLSFGFIGSKFGLSIAASLTNSLVVIGPVLVGLIFRKEWKGMPWQLYLGMLLVVVGITVIAIFKPSK
jgi:hypothetical protein